MPPVHPPGLGECGHRPDMGPASRWASRARPGPARPSEPQPLCLRRLSPGLRAPGNLPFPHALGCAALWHDLQAARRAAREEAPHCPLCVRRPAGGRCPAPHTLPPPPVPLPIPTGHAGSLGAPGSPHTALSGTATLSPADTPVSLWEAPLNPACVSGPPAQQ